jgi:tetratricopeptide (TPR) repeat protein
MNDDAIESEVLRWLDAALGQPADERMAWLTRQALAPAIATRVARMLEREDRISGFLEVPAAASSTFDPGTRVGAWSMLRIIGSGGMGVVYLARRADDAYEQLAAIKFLRVDPLLPAAQRHALVMRFDTERRLLARLDHPGVARILDGGTTDDGVPWLAMDYIAGRPLDVWCDEHRLGVRARCALMRRICNAVQAAHRHLIVHGDLKPSNILVDADGEPRLLDFGIARALDPRDEIARRTVLPAMTPAYASPEQMRLEPLTTASDVYSLGVVLYELASGGSPYDVAGLSPAQSERVICDTAPATLRAALARLPETERIIRATEIAPDLELIVAKAMHKDASRRYATAEAFGDDLQRFVERRAVLAHPDSLAYRARKLLHRHRAASIGAGVLLAAVFAAAGVAWHQARLANRAAEDTGQVNAFLLDVLDVSSPYASGSELTLGEALDAASAKVDERFADRPDLSLVIRTALGESQVSRYRLDEAQVQLELAIRDGERAFGRDDARVVHALSTLGNVRKEQGRDDEARALFEECLLRLRRSDALGTQLHAEVLNDLGVLHLVGEKPALALPYLEQAAAIDLGPDRSSREEHARTLANLAQAARGIGDLDRADALYRQAQPVLEALYPEGGPHLAVILNNRARLAWARGERDAALVLQQQAVAMHRRSFAGDHVMILVPMTNLARMALDHGDVALASEWAASAVAMADRMYAASPHPYHVNALAAVVAIGLHQGRPADVAAAAARMRRTLEALPDPPASTRDFATGLLQTLCAQAEIAPDACG